MTRLRCDKCRTVVEPNAIVHEGGTHFHAHARDTRSGKVFRRVTTCGTWRAFDAPTPSITTRSSP